MRVALYCRVSSEEQVRHGISIDAQISALDEWAKDKTVVDHYVDLGISGRKPYTKRPEMMRLLQDAEKGRIDLIAFVKLDRWFRSVKEYYRVQDILDRNHVAWRAIQEDYETETSSGRFKVNIMLSVAQSEAERTGERVKAVNELKRAKGEFLCGNAPMGLKLENKKLVPSDDAWKVKKAFDAYINTGSIWGAIPIMQEIGVNIKLPSYQYILDNENYLKAGIISQDVWDRAREFRSVPRPRRTVNRTYLFTGLLYCPCGRRLSGMYAKGHYYYRCPGYWQDRSCENNKCVNEEEIEDFLLKDILSKCKGYVKIRSKKSKVVDVSKLKAKMNKLTDLYLNDLIDREKYERDYKSLQKEITEAEKQPKQIEPEVVKTYLDAYKGLEKRESKRIFWHNVIEKATVSEDGVDYTLCFISR